METNIVKFPGAAVSRLPKILSEQDLREIDRKVRASLEEPETPRERRIRERQEAPALTETGRNSRLRIARREAWREAEADTRYWQAKMDFGHACEMAQRHGVQDSFSYNLPDHGKAVREWREALMRQLLTPAPDTGSINWKRKAFAQNQHRFTDTKPERIERAIADDEAFLAAHPVRQSRSGAGS
jgi:hypothetical protein